MTFNLNMLKFKHYNDILWVSYKKRKIYYEFYVDKLNICIYSIIWLNNIVKERNAFKIIFIATLRFRLLLSK